ncbi:MAG: hypothetical protein IPO86_06590 [Saprospiraceae bacterium]|nr:hypothetical protein [Saprospiraceae bacterium]MBK9727771.1 hypothetical protein [Saprospiraceae bacterium]
MKNTSNTLYIAIFLAFISQGIKAQFDDVYYDPDKDRPVERIKEDYKQTTTPLNEDSYSETYDNSSEYDNQYSEWEEQDYYYTSKIKRFHRPFRGFDYYDPCYVDSYFYDPFDFNPWYYDRDIYVSGWGYTDYSRWRHWGHQSHYYNPYWAQRDWCSGWSSFPVSYSYYYWPNNCYSGYSNYGYWGGGYYAHHNNNTWNGNNGETNGNHTNGSYFGSRRFGITNSSNRGPVRVVNPSPRVITEAPGTSVKPGHERGTGRVIRSSDGDVLKPGDPVFRPERNNNPRKENNNVQPNNPGRETGRERYQPREVPGELVNPKSVEPQTRKNYRIESKENPENEGSEFKPKRYLREESPSDSRPRFDAPKERPQERNSAPRQERMEPRSMPKTSPSSRPKTDSPSPRSNNSSSGNTNKESSGGRKSPR